MSSVSTEGFADLVHRSGLSRAEVAELIGRGERQVRRYETGESPTMDRLAWEKVREAADAKCQQRSEASFTFIDLFAGIGGLRRPFEEINGRCVFTSEWDRFAKETYQANFPEAPGSDHEFAGDIRPYADDPTKVPTHDVLLAGFPCQPFSIAGVSKKNALGRPHGFLCDTQGTLFHDLAKIIKHHRPAAFLLENVKNLESHDGGKTFATIMHVLEQELGYTVTKRVISSEPWVPQKRERVFIAGFRDGHAFDFDTVAIPDGEGPKLGTILENQVPPKYTLTEHMWNYLQGYKEKHSKAGNGFGYSLFGPDDVTRTLSARYYKDGSEILIAQDGDRPRRLTPRECARLMGFEEPGAYDFNIPVSDTQAYRQFGNAVVMPVVRAVAEAMRPHIEDAIAAEGRTVPFRQVELPLPAGRAADRHVAARERQVA